MKAMTKAWGYTCAEASLNFQHQNNLVIRFPFLGFSIFAIRLSEANLTCNHSRFNLFR
jgi:hypothetical protein